MSIIDIDEEVLNCIKINFKSISRISEETGINRLRVVKSIYRLKIRDYLTWIEVSAHDGKGFAGVKYLWFEKSIFK